MLPGPPQPTLSLGLQSRPTIGQDATIDALSSMAALMPRQGRHNTDLVPVGPSVYTVLDFSNRGGMTAAVPPPGTAEASQPSSHADFDGDVGPSVGTPSHSRKAIKPHNEGGSQSTVTEVTSWIAKYEKSRKEVSELKRKLRHMSSELHRKEADRRTAESDLRDVLTAILEPAAGGAAEAELLPPQAPTPLALRAVRDIAARAEVRSSPRADSSSAASDSAMLGSLPSSLALSSKKPRQMDTEEAKLPSPRSLSARVTKELNAMLLSEGINTRTPPTAFRSRSADKSTDSVHKDNNDSSAAELVLGSPASPPRASAFSGRHGVHVARPTTPPPPATTTPGGTSTAATAASEATTPPSASSVPAARPLSRSRSLNRSTHPTLSGMVLGSNANAAATASSMSAADRDGPSPSGIIKGYSTGRGGGASSTSETTHASRASAADSSVMMMMRTPTAHFVSSTRKKPSSSSSAAAAAQGNGHSSAIAAVAGAAGPDVGSASEDDHATSSEDDGPVDTSITTGKRVRIARLKAQVMDLKTQLAQAKDSDWVGYKSLRAELAQAEERANRNDKLAKEQARKAKECAASIERLTQQVKDARAEVQALRAQLAEQEDNTKRELADHDSAAVEAMRSLQEELLATRQQLFDARMGINKDDSSFTAAIADASSFGDGGSTRRKGKLVPGVGDNKAHARHRSRSLPELYLNQDIAVASANVDDSQSIDDEYRRRSDDIIRLELAAMESNQRHTQVLHQLAEQEAQLDDLRRQLHAVADERVAALSERDAQWTEVVEAMKKAHADQIVAGQDEALNEQVTAVTQAVMEARAEYDSVMSDWEARTEAWRQETVAGCEKLIESSRAQLEEFRRDNRRLEAQVSAKDAEIQRLQRELAAALENVAAAAVAAAAAVTSAPRQTPTVTISFVAGGGDGGSGLKTPIKTASSAASVQPAQPTPLDPSYFRAVTGEDGGPGTASISTTTTTTTSSSSSTQGTPGTVLFSSAMAHDGPGTPLVTEPVRSSHVQQRQQRQDSAEYGGASDATTAHAVENVVDDDDEDGDDARTASVSSSDAVFTAPVSVWNSITEDQSKPARSLGASLSPFADAGDVDSGGGDIAATSSPGGSSIPSWYRSSSSNNTTSAGVSGSNPRASPASSPLFSTTADRVVKPPPVPPASKWPSGSPTASATAATTAAAPKPHKKPLSVFASRSSTSASSGTSPSAGSSPITGGAGGIRSPATPAVPSAAPASPSPVTTTGAGGLNQPDAGSSGSASTPSFTSASATAPVAREPPTPITSPSPVQVPPKKTSSPPQAHDDSTDTSSPSQPQQAASHSRQPSSSVVDVVSALPVSGLRALLEKAQVAYVDCVEKADLRSRVLQAVTSGAITPSDLAMAFASSRNSQPQAQPQAQHRSRFADTASSNVSSGGGGGSGSAAGGDVGEGGSSKSGTPHRRSRSVNNPGFRKFDPDWDWASRQNTASATTTHTPPQAHSHSQHDNSSSHHRASGHNSSFSDVSSPASYASPTKGNRGTFPSHTTTPKGTSSSRATPDRTPTAGNAATAAATAASGFSTPYSVYGDADGTPEYRGGGGGGGGLRRGASAGSGVSERGGDDVFRNWVAAEAQDGMVYYYHKITRQTRWELPDRALAQKLEERITETLEEAARKSSAKLEELAAKEVSERRAAEIRGSVEGKVNKRISQWAQGKSLAQLLHTLPAVFKGRDIPESIAQAVSGGGGAAGGSGSEPDSLKKQYFKAIRAIHPDKVLDAPEELRFECQRLFMVLSEAYKKHQEAPSSSATTTPAKPQAGYGGRTTTTRRSSFSATSSRR